MPRLTPDARRQVAQHNARHLRRLAWATAGAAGAAAWCLTRTLYLPLMCVVLAWCVAWFGLVGAYCAAREALAMRD